MSHLKASTYEEFKAALAAGGEEPIQVFLSANPYVLQYAIPHSGHHGIWVFPKQMIKPRAQNGTAGLIPDYLVASKSSLGFFWHVVEIKRFDRHLSNAAGDGFGVDANQGIVQCQSYLSHFQNYIDAARANIAAPELVQPEGAILIIGDTDVESSRQISIRSQFERTHDKISVLSYRRLLAGLRHDLAFVTQVPK